jgi:hypothetical protein
MTDKSFDYGDDLEEAILGFVIFEEGHRLENVTMGTIVRVFGISRIGAIKAVTALRVQGLIEPGNLAVRVAWENITHHHVCGAVGIDPRDAYALISLLDTWDSKRGNTGCTCPDCVMIETDIPGFET